jgi:hypothetical protein
MGFRSAKSEVYEDESDAKRTGEQARENCPLARITGCLTVLYLW